VPLHDVFWLSSNEQTGRPTGAVFNGQEHRVFQKFMPFYVHKKEITSESYASNITYRTDSLTCLGENFPPYR
jgi:hypothetical protein